MLNWSIINIHLLRFKENGDWANFLFFARNCKTIVFQKCSSHVQQLYVLLDIGIYLYQRLTTIHVLDTYINVLPKSMSSILISTSYHNPCPRYLYQRLTTIHVLDTYINVLPQSMSSILISTSYHNPCPRLTVS